jgi:hypothetical protein
VNLIDPLTVAPQKNTAVSKWMAPLVEEMLLFIEKEKSYLNTLCPGKTPPSTTAPGAEIH